MVQIGLHKIMVLPDREIDLGIVGDKEEIELKRRVLLDRVEVIARKVMRENAIAG